ncbi:MAG TPA: 4-alpha-glucanotransferase, partial [Treponemataceae bacterium]|nr:4-alpha-glucanotransferase [Treponemataceae bacterium]
MASEISSLERKTGTAVPVSALRTKSSLMCGEFLDLIPFADFCKKSGLSIIQILPVNDTGTESSPYSALSAFALHPMYISLTALPEFDPLSDGGKKTEVLRKKHESDARFSYALVRKEKISLLRSIFSSKKESIISSSELASWIAGNEWIKVYAVFSYYKMQNNEASWKQWKTFTNPSLEQITKVWETPVLQEDLLFYAWVQMRLDEQFAKASTYCKSLGIALKGDIPIMMNEDSSDAWAYPQFFIQSLRAGSPPDGPNPVGQNWGFP